MTEEASKSPFLYSFLIGVVVVLALSTLSFVLLPAWFYFRGRKLGLALSKTAIESPSRMEEGLSAPDPFDFSCRGPSRLGGISPSPAAMVSDESRKSRLSQQVGVTERTEKRGTLQTRSSWSRASIPIILHPTEEVEPEGYTDLIGRAGGVLNLTNAEQAQPRHLSFLLFPPPPNNTPLPPMPLIPNSRISASTVWSQESMWPLEKKSVIPTPSPVYLSVPRRVITFSRSEAPGSASLRSIDSLPRSVGQSDHDDY
ncbi:hypothetical protein BC834DRAFT_626321 [Gloeopeniophorella convolvens]|nr:hypothetical protein BC834DRAFT_626321 [Gloeopeniophorella convolvens]